MKYPKETLYVGSFSPYDFDDLNFAEIQEYLEKQKTAYQPLYPDYELTLDFNNDRDYDSHEFDIYAIKYYDSKEEYDEANKEINKKRLETVRQTELKQLEMLKKKYENQ